MYVATYTCVEFSLHFKLKEDTTNVFLMKCILNSIGR